MTKSYDIARAESYKQFLY